MNFNENILSQIGIEKIVQKDSIIYSQGDDPTVFYYLLNGTVKIYLSSQSGSEKTLKIITDGDAFGEAAFFDGLPRMSNAKAMTKCRLYSINKTQLLEYVRINPELAMSLLESMASTIRNLSGQVDGISFLPADKRVVQVLLTFAQKNKSQLVLLTHEEISSLVGTSRITVTRIISQLVKDGLVKTAYRRIKIEDFEKLESYLNSDE